jgi:hypothetical protein
VDDVKQMQFGIELLCESTGVRGCFRCARAEVRRQEDAFEMDHGQLFSGEITGKSKSTPLMPTIGPGGKESWGTDKPLPE